jgi:hypothetical protein
MEATQTYNLQLLRDSASGLEQIYRANHLWAQMTGQGCFEGLF